jgi:hypothetical protein
MSVSTRRVLLAVVAIHGLCPAFVPVRASPPSATTCEAANPFDRNPDDVALQACLNEYDQVLLKPAGLPGYVGYLLANTIRLRRAGALLTTADNPHKAAIVAAPDLNSSMLRAFGVNNYEISFIRFDGDRDNRAVRDKPCDEVRNYRNLEVSGTGFHVRYIESTGAVCGSAMTVGDSSDFEIDDSLFYDNGRQPEDANNISGLWSDGLTVFKCANATIRDNDFWDNTDVDLGVNGGPSCSVYRNTITHSWKYAFAGLVAGDPTRSGGEFSANTVSSAYDLLGFGILAGCHPWAQCGGGYASNVAVYNNSSTGAVVNLAIDGLTGGSVRNNVISGAQGGRLLNCSGATADYTIGHAINVAPLQGGYVIRTYDFGAKCQ